MNNYNRIITDYNQHFLNTLNTAQKDYIDSLEVEDRVLISRYLYAIGEEPVYTDKIYDMVISVPRLEHYKEKRYEDDPITPELLSHLSFLGKYKEFSMSDDFKERLKLRDNFSTNKSMMCVTSGPELTQKYFKQYLNEDTKYFLLSYKHDGWNISAYYVPGQKEVYMAHTRGRGDAQVSDVTEIMRYLLPELEVDYPTKIVGELVIKKSWMDRLREKYTDRKWVNVRNSIATFIAGNVDKEDWEALSFFAFNMEDLSEKDKSPLEIYEFLGDNNIPTPEWEKVPVDTKEIPKALTRFIKNYQNGIELEYECDGLVMLAITENTINKDIFTSYSTGMVAIKAWYWASEIMQSRVIEVFYSENKRTYTPKARVEPVQSRSGSMAQIVPFDNLRQVATDWIMPGDIIEFEYHSQQNVMYKRKVSGAEKPKKGDKIGCESRAEK